MNGIFSLEEKAHELGYMEVPGCFHRRVRQYQEQGEEKSANKAFDKTDKSARIKGVRTEEEEAMTEIRTLGRINTDVLEAGFGKIQTNEVIVTNERIEHIKERHSDDYLLFEKYGKESVTNPDFIIKDEKT